MLQQEAVRADVWPESGHLQLQADIRCGKVATFVEFGMASAAVPTSTVPGMMSLRDACCGLFGRAHAAFAPESWHAQPQPKPKPSSENAADIEVVD